MADIIDLDTKRDKWLYRPMGYFCRKGIILARISILPVVSCLMMSAILNTGYADADMPVVGQATVPSLSAAADRAEAVKGNNAFAVELYAQLRTQSGNLFFSPESISTALAMTYAGARGRTASELAKTLHITLPQERLHPAMAGLLHELNEPHDGYQLKVANALWAQQDYTFLDDFLKLTRDNYGAGLQHVDFRNAAEQARLTINSWVEQQTDNRIKDLIQSRVLTKDTRLILTDAIYFKGDWETQFDKRQTREEDFHVTPTQTVRVPLMHREGEFRYLDGGTFQALEIPYKGNELSMIIFLPNAVDGLPALEQSLTAANTEQWLGQLYPAPRVIATLPKFEMKARFELRNMLVAMGMRQAFDSTTADFSGMSSPEVQQRAARLYISAVIHKAHVGINEEGTEAAAATAVIMQPDKVITMAPPHLIRADHPFVFLIRYNRFGSILFMGRLTDPSA